MSCEEIILRAKLFGILLIVAGGPLFCLCLMIAAVCHLIKSIEDDEP